MVKAENARGSLAGLREQWRQDPEFLREFDALDEEFALAESFIAARTKAGLTQAQIAERMGTAQSYIARLESGRTIPSVRTLKRFAEATGTKLRLNFVTG